MSLTNDTIYLTETYGANNYHPLPIVISTAKGIFVTDPEGNKYMDMLSGYSAVNQGHCHPRIIQALKEQAEKVTLTSRAFYNDQLGIWFEKVSKLTSKEMILPMNTGAEAVETAMKTARRWAYQVKGVPHNKAEIICCSNNFHGRTFGTVSLSSTEEYKDRFGPLLSGIVTIPFGDATLLEDAIAENTAAFIVEPIQGEAGIIIPPKGYLAQVREICTKHNVLFIADEVQTGFGRTGKLFACEWDNVEPDMYILGKALGGGVIPISCVASNKDILSVLTPGSHGSTFGGNPLACAVSIASIDVILDEHLSAKSLELGNYFMNKLHKINSPLIKEIRGKGLFIGIELYSPARKYCEILKENGILCKETHENVIRLAPPLTIQKEDIDRAFDILKNILEATS